MFLKDEFLGHFFFIDENNFPQLVFQDTTMVMFADDTKCNRSIQNTKNVNRLQTNLDSITN